MRTKVPQTLSDEETGKLFSSLDQNKTAGCRNAAVLLLFLDTGLQSSELRGLRTEDVHMEDQWRKVMGKGQKERIVPSVTRRTKCQRGAQARTSG